MTISHHPDYLYYAPLWQTCRDVLAGQSAVHAGGEAYLPRLSGQTASDYAAYKARALFYNASRRTLEAMLGLLFRKSPRMEMPDALASACRNIDLSGRSLNVFAAHVAAEILSVGRVGLLVDWPEEGGRPTLLSYDAETILDWEAATIGGRQTLIRVLLKEQDVRAGQTLYRELALTEEGYRQQLYRLKGGKPEPVGGPILPLKNGETLTEIPFVFVGARQGAESVTAPPLLDLIHVNLSHYRTSADLEHGAHYTGLPTAVISGHSVTEGESLAIGAGEAWVLPQPDAKAYFLEFEGQGLGTLERLLDRKEAQMAAIGARLLAPAKKAAEAAETERLRHAGENAVLAALAASVSDGMTRALGLMADWMGVKGAVSFAVTQDFLPLVLSAADVKVRIEAWQAGALTEEELFAELKAGELISDGRDFAMHKDAT